MAYRDSDGRFTSNGYDWKHIREKLNKETWSFNRDNDMWERRVWLGTVFGITPSGKVYAPWSTNVTEAEARVDEAWGEDMEKSAEKIDALFYWDDDSGFVGECKDELELGDHYEIANSRGGPSEWGIIELEDQIEEIQDRALSYRKGGVS